MQKQKKKCEIILQKFFKNTNIDLKIFRPFTVYGTFSRPDMIFITYLKKLIKMKNFIFTTMESISETLLTWMIYVKF